MPLGYGCKKGLDPQLVKFREDFHFNKHDLMLSFDCQACQVKYDVLDMSLRQAEC